MYAINFQCIPFNQAFALWIVSSIIMTIIISIFNIIVPKKLEKYYLIITGIITSLTIPVLLLWSILSWSNFWKFSKPCTEYIPYPWLNKKFN